MNQSEPKAFHNPYHFVPVRKGSRSGDLARETFADNHHSTHPHVTHDRYIAGANSGRLICRLTAETPFVVGAKHTADTPAKVEQYKLDGLPAIPASTLRGLISSLTEAATNSSLRVLENETYSYRRRMEASLSAIGMIIEENGHFKLRPLTLPMLNGDPNRNVKLGSEYRDLFAVPNLKVFIGNGTTIKQARYAKEKITYTTKDKRFYYLPLKDREWVNGFEIQPDLGLNWKRGFLLGQLTRYANAEPLTKEQVESQVPADERATYKRGIVRVLGVVGRDIPNNKTHEIFIPYPKEIEANTPIDILPEAIRCFHTLADLRTKDSVTESYTKLLPYHPVSTNRNTNERDKSFRLKDGDLVFFRSEVIAANSKPVVVELSLSSIWRGRVEKKNSTEAATTFDFFSTESEIAEVDSELLPFNKDRKVLTLAEQMFGFVEQNEKKDQKGVEDGSQELSLAGRIYPSPARFAGIKRQDGTWEAISSPNSFYLEDPTDPEGWTLLKILASPKPPSPAMYFKQASGSGGYIAKNRLNPTDHEPQGRKFYLHDHHPDQRPWASRKLDENTLKQKMKVKPVRANSVFYFHIDFENLSELELGALLYALRPSRDFRHKLGLGKPLGLGTVKIEPLGLFLVNRPARYSSASLTSYARYAVVWKAKKSDAEFPWADSDFSLSELPERYACEGEPNDSPAEPTPSDLHQQFRKGMNKGIVGALELIGNPSAVIAPVHYPQVRGQSSNAEEENFKWFVANDLGSGSKRDDNRIEPDKDYERNWLIPLAAPKKKRVPAKTQTPGLNPMADKLKSLGFDDSGTHPPEKESVLTEMPTLDVHPWNES